MSNIERISRARLMARSLGQDVFILLEAGQHVAATSDTLEFYPAAEIVLTVEPSGRVIC